MVFNPDELLNYLRYTPTGDNAQQFTFRCSENSLTVTHSNEIAAHPFNQSNVASILSLGMIMYVVKAYAAKNELCCNISHCNNFNISSEWLTCTFSEEKTDQDPALFNHNLDVIFNRYTDRGIYRRTKNFNFSDLQEKYGNVIAMKSKMSKEAYKAILKFETMMFEDIGVFKSIEKWARYTKKEVLKTKTGMSCKNLGLDFLNGFFFHMISKETIANKFLLPYFKFLTRLKVRLFYPRSSGFALCYIKSGSDDEILTMGEKIMGIWLDITARGGTIQPISSPTLLPFIYRNREGKFHNNYTEDLKSANEKFNKEFNVDGEVIWMFRFGPATKSAKKNRTLRIDLKNK